MYAHTQQVFEEDCGLAVVTTIAKHFNKNVSLLSAYIKDADIYDKMLSLYDLKVLLGYFGINADAYEVYSFSEITKQKFPIIIRTGDGDLAHYVVIHKFENDVFTVSDPADVDITELSYEQVKEKFSNYALITGEVSKQAKVKSANVQKQYLTNVLKKSISAKQKLLLYLVNTTVIVSPLLITTDISLINAPGRTGIIAKLLLIVFLTVYGFTLFYNARLKLRMSNQVVGKLLSESFESGLDELDLDKSENEISSYFWNIFNAGNGLVNKYFVYFDFAYAGSLLVAVALFNIKMAIVLILGFGLAIVLLREPIKRLIIENKKMVESSGEWTNTFLMMLKNKLDIYVSDKRRGISKFYSNKMMSYFSSTEAMTDASTKVSVIMSIVIMSTIAASLLITGSQAVSGIGGATVYIMFMASEGFSELTRDYIGFVSSKSEIEFITSRVAWEQKDKNKLTVVDGTIDRIRTKNLSIKVAENHLISYPNAIFEKGNSYLITGKNGVGKSTFVKILSGIYRGYEGDVTINDVDSLEGVNVSSKIAYYSNELNVFNGTVANNITLSEFEDDRQMEIKDFGFSVDLSKRVSKDNISSGQKQKILLLRALNKDADVYIFDEPLSNMDIVSKQHFAKVVESLINDNKIVIVITHEKLEYEFKQILNFEDQL